MVSFGDVVRNRAEEKQIFHLQSLIQEVVASLQAVVVFIGVTPVTDQEHQGLKHKD